MSTAVKLRMSYDEIKNLSYDNLQKLLVQRFPTAVSHETEERQKQLKLLSTEDLTILIEYCRRNLSFGRSDAIITYEDAVKTLYIPELLRRLSNTIEVGPFIKDV